MVGVRDCEGCGGVCHGEKLSRQRIVCLHEYLFCYRVSTVRTLLSCDYSPHILETMWVCFRYVCQEAPGSFRFSFATPPILNHRPQQLNNATTTKHRHSRTQPIALLCCRDTRRCMNCPIERNLKSLFECSVSSTEHLTRKDSCD